MSFKGAVNWATGSRTVEVIARSGYPVNGVLHLLIAYIIVRIAFGFRGEADQTGALATLADQRGGESSLWIVAAGLLALAMWRLAETVIGLHPGEHSHAHLRESPLVNRLKAFGLALLYLGLSFTAAQFALGVGRQGSERAVGLSARLMRTEGGNLVLVAVGAVIAAIGAYLVYKGAMKKFLRDLTVRGGLLITVLGMCGHIGEGIVLFAAGASVIGAPFLRDPSKAAWLDAAVKTVGHTQFGRTLLLFAAVGFAAYGLYSFALTRYSRM